MIRIYGLKQGTGEGVAEASDPDEVLNLALKLAIAENAGMFRPAMQKGLDEA